MGEFWDKLKSGVSYESLVRASHNAPTIPNLLNRALDTTHETRVFKDGIRDGTAALAGETIGFLGHVGRFIVQHTTGIKLQEVSGEWLTERIRELQDDEMKILGETRPELRDGTPDKLIHIGGKLVPIGASLFIPGGQGSGYITATNLLARGTKLVGLPLATELGMGAIEWAEEKAGVNPSLASLFSSEAKAEEKEAPTTSQRLVVGKIGPAPLATPAQTTKILDMVLSNGLQSKEDSTRFDPEKTKQLQTILADAKQYNPKEVEGLVGDKTMAGLDKVLRSTIKPASLDASLRSSYEARMKDLSKDLRDNPANPYAYDPRVVAVQTCGYALGLYNKKIDGLTGPATEKAIEFMENKTTGTTPKITQTEVPRSPEVKQVMAPT